MGQVLHGCATTTEAVRRAIQHSQASLRTLAQALRNHPKTVAKWKKRATVADLPTGPRRPSRASFRIEDEAIIVAFRRHTLLPLDDCLYALQADDPASDPLVPASLPAAPRHLADCQRSKATSRTSGSSRPIRSAISTSTSPKSAPPRASSISSSPSTGPRSSPSSNCIEKATTAVAADFLRALIQAVPYKVHTVLTDNGIHFTDPAGGLDRHGNQGDDGAWRTLPRACLRICLRTADVDHRLTKPKHPWTNGQVERMNRTIKDATVKRFYYETHDQLRSPPRRLRHPTISPKRLKTLKGLTPYEFVCKAMDTQPERFNSTRSIKCRD